MILQPQKLKSFSLRDRSHGNKSILHGRNGIIGTWNPTVTLSEHNSCTQAAKCTRVHSDKSNRDLRKSFRWLEWKEGLWEKLLQEQESYQYCCLPMECCGTDIWSIRNFGSQFGSSHQKESSFRCSLSHMLLWISLYSPLSLANKNLSIP